MGKDTVVSQWEFPELYELRQLSWQSLQLIAIQPQPPDALQPAYALQRGQAIGGEGHGPE